MTTTTNAALRDTGYVVVRPSSGFQNTQTLNFEDIQPAVDKEGKLLAYTKPILLLMDEFSLSAAEAFSMFLQDQHRATVLGVRTDGGGGNPGSYPAGVYSEGNTRVTRTLGLEARSEIDLDPCVPSSLY